MGNAALAPAFRSKRGLRRALIGLLAMDIALAWIAIQSGLTFVQLVWQALAGHFLPSVSLEAYGRQFAGLRVAQLAGWLLTAILFFRWFGAADENLAALSVRSLGDCRERTVAGGATLFACFARLPQMLGGLWLASEPVPDGHGPSRLGAVPAWVAWWWIAPALALAAEIASGLLAARSGGWLAPGGPLQLLLLAQMLEIVAAVFAIALVHGVSDRQERLARALELRPL